MVVPWRRGWVGQNLAARSPAAGGGGGGGSTFNISRKGAGISLTNGALTAEGFASSESVDSTTSHSSGLWHVEFRLDATSGAFPMVGVGNSSHPVLSSDPGYLGVDGNSAGLVVDGTGGRFFGGASLGSDGTYTNPAAVGDWVAIEVDLNASPFTIRWRSQAMAGWSAALSLTGMSGPIFYAVGPDAGTKFTVNPTGTVIPLGSASVWG